MEQLMALMTEMRNDIKYIKTENGQLREEVGKIKEELERKDKERNPAIEK